MILTSFNIFRHKTNLTNRDSCLKRVYQNLKKKYIKSNYEKVTKSKNIYFFRSKIKINFTMSLLNNVHIKRLVWYGCRHTIFFLLAVRENQNKIDFWP